MMLQVGGSLGSVLSSNIGFGLKMGWLYIWFWALNTSNLLIFGIL